MSEISGVLPVIAGERHEFIQDAALGPDRARPIAFDNRLHQLLPRIEDVGDFLEREAECLRFLDKPQLLNRLF